MISLLSCSMEDKEYRWLELTFHLQEIWLLPSGLSHVQNFSAFKILYNILVYRKTLVTQSTVPNTDPASIILIIVLLKINQFLNYRNKIDMTLQFSSVQLLIHVWLFATPWTEALQASLSITNSWSLVKLMSIESVMPSKHLILCCPLLLLPSIFPSIRVSSSESALCIRWPKYWSFSFNISPSNEYSGLMSFRMDWLYILAVQGTLKSLLQHHSWKASILWYSAFFIVQL